MKTLKNLENDELQQRRQIQDLKYMKMAFDLAKKAEKLGEVPVGAVLVDEKGQLIAKSINLREKKHSVLGHAELIALHRAGQKLNSWRLVGCTLYVTLEPCLMCAAALVQARIARVVYATPDPKAGGLGSLENLATDPRLNHRFDVSRGLLATESSDLLKNFFKLKRKKSKL